MFVVFIVTKREGEQDYGEQTLASPTFQRSHFRIGVVHTVLVSVKVQGAKGMFLSEMQMVYFRRLV